MSALNNTWVLPLALGPENTKSILSSSSVNINANLILVKLDKSKYKVSVSPTSKLICINSSKVVLVNLLSKISLCCKEILWLSSKFLSFSKISYNEIAIVLTIYLINNYNLLNLINNERYLLINSSIFEPVLAEISKKWLKL